jgi:hypothetical protein
MVVSKVAGYGLDDRGSMLYREELGLFLFALGITKPQTH